jgi:hypothetical protein
LNATREESAFCVREIADLERRLQVLYSTRDNAVAQGQKLAAEEIVMAAAHALAVADLDEKQTGTDYFASSCGAARTVFEGSTQSLELTKAERNGRMRSRDDRVAFQTSQRRLIEQQTRKMESLRMTLGSLAARLKREGGKREERGGRQV